MEEWINLILFIIFGAVALLLKDVKSEGLERRNLTFTSGRGRDNLASLGEFPNGGRGVATLPEFVEAGGDFTCPTEPPSCRSSCLQHSDPVEEETPAPISSLMLREQLRGSRCLPQTFRQGIILAEILRPPKSLREPRQ